MLSGPYQDATYQDWHRNLTGVRAEAQRRCADGHLVVSLHPARRDLVAGLCDDLPASQQAAEDAASNAALLKHACDAGRAGACLLQGTAVQLGIAGARDEFGATVLLRRACELGSDMGCEERNGTLHRLLEPAP